MRLWILVLGGCSGDATDEGADPSATGCAFELADDLPDVENEMFGQEHACEDQPAYDDYADFGFVTIWYVGDFHVDGCGVVSGREIWKVYPTPVVEERGMSDCEVVYDVTGAKGEPIERGDYSLTIALDIDLDETTCEILDDQPLWSGYEHMDVAYDVDVDEGGGSAVYYASGTLLGQGYSNESHVNYLAAEFVCTAYSTD